MNVTDEPQTKTNTLATVARYIAPLFAVVIALTYGCGYLCLSTFLDRFGIHEPSGDFLKIRYIYTGILFLLFPITILVPLVITISLKRSDIKAHTKRVENLSSLNLGNIDEMLEDARVKVSSLVSYINLCVVLYVVFLLMPHELVQEKLKLIPLIIIVSLVLPLIVRRAIFTVIVPKYTHVTSWIIRWLLVLTIIGGLDYWIFRGVRRQLLEMFFTDSGVLRGASYYVIFVGLIPYMYWRSSRRVRLVDVARSRVEMRILNFCLNLMFCFMAILSFGLGVFPYIPSSKGGGNYMDSPTVMLKFRDGHVDMKDPINSELSESNEYIVLDRTPESIFVAKITDAGGPRKWCELRRTPKIIEVRRDSIERIVFNERR